MTTKTPESIALDIRREVFSVGKLLPARASELLVMLNAVIGTLGEIEIEKEMIYNQLVATHQVTEGSKAKAEVIAKTSDEYREYRMAKWLKENSVSGVGTLKYFLREKSEEYKKGMY